MEPGAGFFKIGTDLAIELPSSHYARIESRSGWASKHGLFVFNGIIDSDYRGPLKVMFGNIGREAVQIKRGMRVAQLCLLPRVQVRWLERSALGNTYRGSLPVLVQRV